MAATNTKPWAVGLLRSGPEAPYVIPLGEEELDRDAQWAMRQFERMGIQPGKPALLIGSGGDYHLLWPCEDALTRMKVPFGQAEVLAADAARSAMFLRRLQLQAVLGITLDILDALPMHGLDVSRLFANMPVICAAPGAWEKLRSLGCAPWQEIRLGPLYGFQPPDEEGYLYNQDEWLLEENEGRLLVTNRRPRMFDFKRMNFGITGRLIEVDGEKRVLLT
ncbi:MAG: hypothetical protein LBE62_08410 [Azonexus sp.]|jgi:hypothetical protein|nr:hypothetical protein [Azonexus sp.]